MKPPIKAVYQLREDGDYDFKAAFNNDTEVGSGEDVAEQFAENLRAEGETVIVRDFDDITRLVDVLTVKDEDEYEVEICETNTLVKKVQATSPQDAVKYVSALYKAGEIVLKGNPDTNEDYTVKSI